MPSNGYIQVHAYASDAQLPLPDTAIVVATTDGTAIALRLTDRSGRITPIEVPTPDTAESQSPDPGEQPFTVVNLYAYHNGYEWVEAENLQVFPNSTTLQELQLVPLAELPDAPDQGMIFDTPPQNL